jgi:lipopolysaccharide transport system permease protein
MLTSVKQPLESRVVVRSPRGSRANLSELWQTRELIYLLILRDVKVRYKQTVFGVGWALIQPLLMVVVFSVFLGRVPDLHPQGVSYPLFALTGLVPWTFFAQGVTGAANSLVESERLITKVYFPRLVLPITGVGSYIPDLLIGLCVLLVATIAFGPPLTLAVIWILPMAVLAALAALSIGLWLSAVNVRYRDVRYAIPFLLQLWLFATPVVYAAGVVPADYRWLLALNPMAGVVEGFRWALLGLEPRPDALIAAAIVVILVLVVGGTAYFRSAERTFADVI